MRVTTMLSTSTLTPFTQLKMFFFFIIKTLGQQDKDVGHPYCPS